MITIDLKIFKILVRCVIRITLTALFICNLISLLTRIFLIKVNQTYFSLNFFLDNLFVDIRANMSLYKFPLNILPHLRILLILLFLFILRFCHLIWSLAHWTWLRFLLLHIFTLAEDISLLVAKFLILTFHFSLKFVIFIRMIMDHLETGSEQQWSHQFPLGLLE